MCNNETKKAPPSQAHTYEYTGYGCGCVRTHTDSQIRSIQLKLELKSFEYTKAGNGVDCYNTFDRRSKNNKRSARYNCSDCHFFHRQNLLLCWLYCRPSE